MTTLSDRTEEAYLKERALYYKNKGYSVHLAPDKSLLPDFLVGFQPVLIAQNEIENVVVEVRTRASLRNDSNIDKLEEVIKGHPGWRFELVIPAEKRELPPDADPKLILDEVEKLQSLELSDAALLLVWNAIEIGLRKIAKAGNVELKMQSPAYLLQELTSLGLLEEGVYNVLWDALKVRNAVAHGFKAPENEAVSVDRLLEIAKSLI